jgi:tRNA(Ile)-lysidine synthase
VHLQWREDPTNRELRYARNALRARVLPDIERLVAPGARRALVRLAERAHQDEAGWSSVLPALLAPLDVRRDSAGLSLDRGALLALHPAVRARVLRALAQEVGARLDDSATGRALDFAASGASGRRIELGGPWRLGRELGRLVLRVERAPPADRPVRIHDAGPGFGEALLAGSAVRVRWGEERPGALAQREAFDPQLLRFPLIVRARAPGDRIRLAGGSKKVKELLLERRIPHARRGSVPLLADGDGAVLWIPEIARATRPVTNRPGGVPCWIEVG